MDKLLEIFSTREVSIIFWLLILFVFSLLKAGKSFLHVLKSFFAINLFTAFLSLFIYVIFTIYFLHENKFWDIGLLKDTLVWFISSAMILFFNINKATDTTYFKNILIDNFKAVVILEFILNFYTFSLSTEMIIIPVISFIVVLKLFAENSARTNPEHKKVVSCLNYLINFSVIFIFFYTLSKTITDYSKLIELETLKSFILPILLTSFIIPYFYLLALFINYETLFVRINFMFQDKKRKNSLKKYVLIYSHFSLNKLNRISSGLNKFDIYHSEELRQYIKKLSN